MLNYGREIFSPGNSLGWIGGWIGDWAAGCESTCPLRAWKVSNQTSCFPENLVWLQLKLLRKKGKKEKLELMIIARCAMSY